MWFRCVVIACICIAVISCSSGEKSGSPPSPPIISVTPKDNAIQVAWQHAGGNIQYDIYMTTQAGLAQSQWPLLATNIHSPYEINGLINGQSYRVYVIARNHDGQSKASNIATASPKPPPLPPVLNTPLSSVNSITLSWQAVPDADQYIVYSATSDIFDTENIELAADGKKYPANSESSITLTGFTPGVIYFFVVNAVNSSGESKAASNIQSSMLLPEIPVVQRAVGRHLAATVEWQSITGAQQYNLFIAESPGIRADNSNALPGFTIHENVTSPYTLEGLINYKEYYIAVQAVNALGAVSELSQEALLKPVSPTPIAAGERHTCALRSDNSLWCWGDNTSSRLGNGSGADSVHSQPQPVDSILQWVDISVGFSHSCAISTQGFLACWGHSIYGALGGAMDRQASKPLIFDDRKSDWKKIDAGYFHNCAIDSAGKLFCWGEGSAFQLGYNSESSSANPTREVANSDMRWVEVSAGWFHSCGIKENETLWCWGRGDLGRIGDNRNGDFSATVPSLVSAIAGAANRWRSVSAGHSHTCGIQTDGSLWCWGDNSSGQVGIGQPGEPLEVRKPARVGNANNWQQVTAANAYTCAINNAHALYCWGYNGYGQLGGSDTGHYKQSMLHKLEGDDWASLSETLVHHICAVKLDATHWCWGSNQFTQLTTQFIPGVINAVVNTPQSITPSQGWLSLSAGRDHNCAVHGDNTLWCWGENKNGQLGTGTTLAEQIPVQISEDQTWTSVTAGENHSCALNMNNELHCWGEVSDGSMVLTPTPVGLSKQWMRPSIGNRHGCAIAIEASVSLYCWGDNANGQLGLDPMVVSNTDSPIPVSNDVDWLELSLGTNFSCGIRGLTLPDFSFGSGLFCWGAADKVRNGVGSDVILPFQIESNKQWFSVAAGDQHACAIDSNDGIYCWGSNTFKQLGDQNRTSSVEDFPVAINTDNTDWKSVSTKYTHACAIKRNGILYCWGRWDRGQLGTGGYRRDFDTPESSGDPQQISDKDWSVVATGEHHTCALESNSVLWCWGDNTRGQMGNGMAWSVAPVQILYE